MRRLCLVALISFEVLIFAAAQSKNSQDDASVHRFLQGFDNGLKEKYVVAFTDLNGDGKPEAVVHLVSNDWCGSGGCTTLVLARDGDSWRVLSKISVTRPPIRVLTTKSKGWRSIAVWVQGGGILPGHEAELRFDGKKYPANPTMAPARATGGKAEGETVIPSRMRQ